MKIPRDGILEESWREDEDENEEEAWNYQMSERKRERLSDQIKLLRNSGFH